MPRRSSFARPSIWSWIPAHHGAFCHLSGRPLLAEVEPSATPRRSDHVWITVDVPPNPGFLRVVVNTFSLRNLDAGFDPRIQVGRTRTPAQKLPDAALESCKGLSYEGIESSHNIFYEHFSKEEVEGFLIRHSRAAIWMEAWGDLFLRRECGLHQIHCRRPSCGVRESEINRDGALRLYFKTHDDELYSDLLLFKFCGQ